MELKKSLVIIAAVFCLLLLSTVSYGTEREDTKSDTWLKAKLVTSYTLNEHLNPFKIEVDVTDGVAKISGEVDSEIERDLAVEIARSIDGITEVREELTIEPREKQQEENEFSRKVDDATTTAKVKYRLMLNRNTEGIGINVDTENNVVTLTGTVASDAQKDLTVKLAQNTTGVKEVKDNLTVAAKKDMEQKKTDFSIKKSMEKLSGDVKDSWITTKAKSVLLVSKEAEGAKYEISTENAVITISGMVRSEKQKAEIQQILEELQGVQELNNKLEIR